MTFTERSIVKLLIILVNGLSSLSSEVCGSDLMLNSAGMVATSNGNFMSCRDVDFSLYHAVCQLTNGDLDTSLHGSTYTPASTSACPDGSFDKVCYPKTSPGCCSHYDCFCHSIVQVDDDVAATHWSSWEPLDPPVDGVHYTRSLKMDGSECIAEETLMFPAMPVVAHYDLPEGVYSATSYYTSFYPHKASIDSYLTVGEKCGWAAGVGHNDPWLAITLPTQYMIIGVLIKKRCDAAQYATEVDIKTSPDDSTWQDVSNNVDLNVLYDANMAAYVWFTEIYTTRFWKVYITGYYDHPTMKCDVMGRVV